MRRGGRPTRKRRGGLTRRPARAMRRGGRPTTRRMRHGGSLANTSSGHKLTFPSRNRDGVQLVGGTMDTHVQPIGGKNMGPNDTPVARLRGRGQSRRRMAPPYLDKFR